MAKFNVIPKNGGDPKYSGTPTFTGTYMKPGMLEFREIASPTPIEWLPGDYVVYTRTGMTYRLYNVPQLKKQARSTEYGGAFVYQSVQFFDDSKQLEICPFRDLVTGDNRIHFSTQPSISTFEPVDGIARRLQACLEDMYGSGSWAVRVATVAEDGISRDLATLMDEAREFTVSGVSIEGALAKVYEIWPDVGYVFKIENSTNTIVIGGGGVSTTTQFLYGKGNGLRSITRNVANADELANRLFVYGSSRNMLPGWYNSQNIKDAASVNIQNLMVPIDAIPAMGWSGWGKTGNLPDPAKAYVQDNASVTRLGLRPKTYYFDGSGDLPEIYPTVRNVTIAEVRASNPDYVPSSTVYTDGTARVDKILSAPVPTDSGLAGDEGKSAVVTDTSTISTSGSGTVPSSVAATQKAYTSAFFTKTITISEAGTFSLRLNCPLSGAVNTALGYVGVVLRAYKIDNGAETLIGERETRLAQATPDSSVWSFGTVTLTVAQTAFLANQTVRFDALLSLAKVNPAGDVPYSYGVQGTATVNASLFRKNTFTVSLRQIGFDIEKYAALGDGKTMAMRSGDCVGRSFQILSCSYVSSTDSWLLELSRSEDESLSQWFPNSTYKVAAGDEFVLLDIAMPEQYIRIAEKRLLQSAQDLLTDTATERWQYVPEIDAKYMVENSRVITAGQNMRLYDEDIIGLTAVDVLVDTLTISESESAIPTYKVTLRDRKRITFTESEAVPGVQSKAVTSITEAPETYNGATDFQDSYFELDENGNVTLKSTYQNLWVPGWMAAGGVGTGGGGGGGGSNVSWGSAVGYVIPLTVDGRTEQLLMNGALNGYALQSAIPTALSQLSTDTTHRVVTDDQIAAWNSMGGVSSVTLNSGTGITVTNSGVAITDIGSRTISISSTYQTRINNGQTAYDWGNHANAGYLTSETDPTVPSWAKQSQLQFSALPAMYVGKTPVKGNNTSNDTLIGIDGFTTAASTSASGDTSKVMWDSGNSAWHFYGNIYADGWIAAGGIGTGGGGGGGGVDLDRVWESLTNNTDKPNVKINIAHIPDITTSKITDLESWIAGKGYLTSYTEQYTGTVTSVTLTQGTGITVTNTGTAITSTGTRTISISSTYRNYITHGETAYTWGDHSQMGYLTQHQDLSGYALKTGGSDYEFLVSQLKFSNGWFVGGSYNSTARPQWKYGSTTKNLAYLDEIPTALKCPYSLTFGSKSYDGSANRTITAADLSALTSSEINALLAGYLPLTGGTLTGDLRLKGSSNYERKINFGDGDYVYLHEDDDDHLTIYADKGVSIVSDDGYGLVAPSFIEIGEVRLEYDDTSKALHVTMADGSSETIGLYADGFVSAGGTTTASGLKFVSLTGNQTVAGIKTFSNAAVFNDAVTFSTRIGVGGAPNNSYALYVTGSQSMSGSLTVGGSATVTSGLGVGTAWAGSSYKLLVNGSARATAWDTTSDRRLKDDITEIDMDEAIEKIMAFKPYTWTWNSGLAKGSKAAGFIAQDIENIVPYMVSGEDYKSLNYQMLHAFEVSAIQSHESRLRRLEELLKKEERI